MIPFQFPDLVSKKPKIRGFGWSFNGMREQGSLKGEGTHRGNLFAYNSEQNLAEKNSFKFRIKKIPLNILSKNIDFWRKWSTFFQ